MVPNNFFGKVEKGLVNVMEELLDRIARDAVPGLKERCKSQGRLAVENAKVSQAILGAARLPETDHV